MGKEGLLFPCPIFRSAFFQACMRIFRFPWFVAHVLADYGKRTTEGPHSLGKAGCRFPSYTHTIRCTPGNPTPTERNPSAQWAVTYALLRLRPDFCAQNLRSRPVLCPFALNFGSSVGVRPVTGTEAACMRRGASPGPSTRPLFLSESRHQIVINLTQTKL